MKNNGLLRDLPHHVERVSEGADRTMIYFFSFSGRLIHIILYGAVRARAHAHTARPQFKQSHKNVAHRVQSTHRQRENFNKQHDGHGVGGVGWGGLQPNDEDS